jgi:hypothetical protein
LQAMSSIQGRHMDITRIEGPTGRQTTTKPGGHRGPTLGPTGQSPCESTGQGGPTRGRPTSQVGRTDLVSAHLSLPRGASLMAPDPFPGYSHHFSRSCPRPINSCEGVTPQFFLISIINANHRFKQVKHVEIGQTLVNLGHHLENLVNNH